MNKRLINPVSTPGIAVLTLGLSNQSSSGLPLPANLVAVGAPGGWLLNSLDLLLAAPVLASATDFQLALPPSSGIVGLRMWTQGAAFDPTTNAFGMVVSNGIEQFVGL